MSWSDERVEKLKKMWAEGQSASQIAKELGGVTRNAVIGKVHRLGLSNRNGSGGGTTTEAAPKPKPAAAKPRGKAKPAAKPAPKPEPKPELAEEETVEAASPPASRAKAIIPAGQPLPPQPSANEIDPEALAKVSEVEKKAKKLMQKEGLESGADYHKRMKEKNKAPINPFPVPKGKKPAAKKPSAAPKDTRTDAQKMTDATGPRPGSRYRGD